MNDKTFIVPSEKLIAIPVDTERDAEIPYMYDAIKEYIEQHNQCSILEIGNTSHNYFDVYTLGCNDYDILDFYEVGTNRRKGVKDIKTINEDIRYYKSNKKYDLIYSISTLEHLGFVANNHNPVEPYASIDALLSIKSLLAYGGLFIFTVPMNWNPHIHLILDSITTFKRNVYIRRVSIDRWEQCSKEEASTCKYGTPFKNGNAIRISYMYN